MQYLIKRIMDLFLSVLFIIILFPIGFLIAIAIKLESGGEGSIFYKHKRVGKNRREFTCFKFRSMKIGSDPNILPTDQDDKRITRVGKFIRNTSLDEMPQLLNVLIGNMSFVGPRPALPSQVEKFSKKDFDKLLVKPGITGWTQVNGRNSLEYEKRMEMDCWYAKNWNIFLDIMILLKTSSAIFKQEGIYDIPR